MDAEQVDRCMTAGFKILLFSFGLPLILAAGVLMVITFCVGWVGLWFAGLWKREAGKP